MYKEEKNGYNDTSQKIRKYLSSPKEASRNAEAAFLGASAMFRGFKMGIWGGVLPGVAKHGASVFPQSIFLYFPIIPSFQQFTIIQTGWNPYTPLRYK